MGLVRFGVSLEKELLAQFDRLSSRNKYASRSEAIRDLIRDALVESQWQAVKGDITAVVTLVYDHHRRELVDRLINIQHDHQKMIISSQHIHLDHDNCLEVIILKGIARSAEDLSARLRSVKGVKHGGLVMTTTGGSIR